MGVKLSEWHPWGRTLKALRIAERIQKFCDESNPPIRYEQFLPALEHPHNTKAVKLLEEFCGNGLENSWPSDDTFRLTAVLLTTYFIEKIEDPDD
jgi:hypothetical protein